MFPNLLIHSVLYNHLRRSNSTTHVPFGHLNQCPCASPIACTTCSLSVSVRAPATTPTLRLTSFSVASILRRSSSLMSWPRLRRTATASNLAFNSRLIAEDVWLSWAAMTASDSRVASRVMSVCSWSLRRRRWVNAHCLSSSIWAFTGASGRSLAFFSRLATLFSRLATFSRHTASSMPSDGSLRRDVMCSSSSVSSSRIRLAWPIRATLARSFVSSIVFSSPMMRRFTASMSSSVLLTMAP